MESSQTRTGVVDGPADPAQAKPDVSTKADKAMEADFRALTKDLAASRTFPHVPRDDFNAARSAMSICLCLRLS